MKFLIDMPLSPDLVQWLEGFGHDAVHATTLGLHRASDEEIMRVARLDSRCVITADLDYPRLLATSSALSPTVILFRSGPWSETEIRQSLALALDALRQESGPAVLSITPQGIRRRSLPLG
jgi:predicted nuclease of predicted toxin-antitoxin system